MPLLLCPNCNASMSAVNRSGIEFDMCPQCRGVWLDRGELEKLMALSREEGEASQAAAPAAAPRPEHRPQPRQDYRPDYRSERPYDERYRGEHRDDHYRYKKRKRFDLFDIFD